MNRRDFLKFLLAAPVAAELDIEKLLYVPKPMIVVPEFKTFISTSDIIAIEWERMMPKIKDLFERDDFFYRRLIK